MVRGTSRRWWLRPLLLAILVLGAIPAMASALGISLDRSPAPPQAVVPGATQTLNYTITHATVADRWTLAITDPLGLNVFSQTIPAGGQTGTINGGATWQPSTGSTEGRYRANLDFYSFPQPASVEASALVTFDVANQVGTLQLIKFEDLNGNGVRDTGEPGVPGWTFRLVNPQGNGSVVVTGPDGTVTIPSVPAGNWTVTEVLEPGWVAISNVTGPLTIPANGIGVYTAANARPADICGVVFLDANRNGVLDAGETRYPGATLTLGGGNSGTTTSGPDGAYCFPDLPPGTYSVTVTTPSGYTLTTQRVISNISLRSGASSQDNNFGLTSPGATAQGGPAPDVRINKAGPATATRNSTFTYTITVRNRSNFTAENVEVTDLVPASLTLVAIPSGAVMRNGVVTWVVGDLRAGQSRVLRMQVRVNPNASGTIVNTATVTADGLPARRSRTTTRVPGAAPEPRSGGVTG